MDTLTHGLCGIVVTKTELNRGLGRWSTIRGFAVEVFPDSDFLLGFWSEELSLPYNRNFT
jgi:hypothetical protein